MCDDNHPKPTDVIDVSEWEHLTKSCFRKELSLHLKISDDLQLYCIFWILEEIKKIKGYLTS